jgi:hypothetical protein
MSSFASVPGSCFDLTSTSGVTSLFSSFLPFFISSLSHFPHLSKGFFAPDFFSFFNRNHQPIMSSTADGSIDQETADLILKLQLEDAGVYLESCTGKSKDPTDRQVAFELQREQLEAVCQNLSDKRMALSIAAAVQADQQILARELAAQPQTRSRTTAPLDNTAFAKFQDLSRIAIDTSYWQPNYPEPDEPESSAWAAGRKPEPVRLSRCVACQDDVNLFDIATIALRTRVLPIMHHRAVPTLTHRRVPVSPPLLQGYDRP